MKLHSLSHRRHFLKDAARILHRTHLMGGLCKKWEAVTSEKGLNSHMGQQHDMHNCRPTY